MLFSVLRLWLAGAAVFASLLLVGCRREAGSPVPDEGSTPTKPADEPKDKRADKDDDPDGGRPRGKPGKKASFNAVALAQLLRKDENALDRYKDAVLRLEGKVVKVDLTPDGRDPGDVEVELRGVTDDPDESKNIRIFCTLRDKPGAAKVGPGQMVTLEGTLLDKVNNLVFIRNGTVVKAGPVAFTQVEIERLRKERPKTIAALEKLEVIGAREGRVQFTDKHFTAQGEIQPEVLALLVRFGGLEDVDLSRTPISDAGLAGLKKLVHVRSLHLSETKIGDVGLGHLKDVRGLEGLKIWSALDDRRGLAITNAGLAHLKGLEDLVSLGIGKAQITDAGLAHLGQLRNLEVLELHGNNITDAGLLHLRRLRKLAHLRLPGTQVEGKNLAKLKEMGSLRELDLKGCPVSDAGLAALASLPLRDLYLAKNAKVTPAGLAKLKTARPELTIHFINE
jgi:hypothetical protein